MIHRLINKLKIVLWEIRGSRRSNVLFAEAERLGDW